jgi:amidophosphoribosyltransferase
MDFPTVDELVAGNKKIDEVKKIIDVDSLSYLSLEGTLKSTSKSGNNFCTACFSGEYPIEMKGKNDQEVSTIPSCP